MDEKFSSNNFKNDEMTWNNKESEYENLIIRIKEISRTISLLQKTILK
jgi:hypothetical protein